MKLYLLSGDALMKKFVSLWRKCSERGLDVEIASAEYLRCSQRLVAHSLQVANQVANQKEQHQKCSVRKIAAA